MQEYKYVLSNASKERWVDMWPEGWWDSTDTVKILEEIFKHQKIVTVYIAGPYTNGDTERNIQVAIDTAEKLFALGYVPFVPHLNHYWHLRHPRSYEHWMQWCCVWLSRCDAVLRLEGESKGADDEVVLANEFQIPVFYSVNELWGATHTY